MESVTIYRVNAFTDQLFRGNPAGVCISEHALPEELMKNIAMEMAASETAFVTLHNMKLRWFTPVKEVSLCGHATLSAAYVLYALHLIDKENTITFQTISGPLVARSSGGHIKMDFPRIEVTEQGAGSELLDALGVQGDDLIFEGMAGKKHLLHLKSERCLNTVSPDFSRLMKLEGRGVIMTSVSENHSYDFVSRYFAPWVGVNEDPVTGSAHCALMPYWHKKNAKSKMIAYQNSSRGGEVLMDLCENSVVISGKAVVSLQGTINVKQ